MKAEEIAQLLPDIFQRTLPRTEDKERVEGNVLLALLRVMETHHFPVDVTLAQLHRYFLPGQTDDSFLPFLAQWLDLAWLVEGWPTLGPQEMHTLRTLLPHAAELSGQRGTRQGILRCLRLATGSSGFQIEEAAGRAYHIIVTYPPDVDRHLVAVIVEHMKPAHVTFELYSAGAAFDNNSFLFLQGAWEVLQPKIADGTFVIKNSSIAVALKAKAELSRDEMDKIIGQVTTNWDFNTAKRLAKSNLKAASAVDKGNVFILAPNDETARAIIGAFAADKDVKSYVITGQDAEEASVQSILDGKQSMTVFKDVRTLADSALNAAGAFLEGKTPSQTTTYNNGKIDVPAKLCEVMTIDKNNVKAALIDSGYWPATHFTGLDATSAALPVSISTATVSGKVGIVLPTKDEPRWTQDETRFREALKTKGYEFEILFSRGDSAKEQDNVESLIAKGIKVLILSPHNGVEAAAVASEARRAGVKVIAYDRLILKTDAIDYYVTFDNIAVGKSQAQYLVDHATGTGNPLYLYAGAASHSGGKQR